MPGHGRERFGQTRISKCDFIAIFKRRARSCSVATRLPAQQSGVDEGLAVKHKGSGPDPDRWEATAVEAGGSQ